MTYGNGRVYRRGATWWISYYFRGNELRESAKTADEKAAKRFLQQRLKDRLKPRFVGPAEDRWMIDDIEKKLEVDYTRKANRSFKNVQHCFKHLRKYFGFHRVVDITTADVERYLTARLQEGAARATVNREVEYLRHGLRLMLGAKEISDMPMIKRLAGENVRQGFIDAAGFQDLLIHIPSKKVHSVVRDVIEFLFNSGWRSGEVIKLEWREVDLRGGMIKLVRENNKTKTVRLVPIVGSLQEIIDRRVKLRDLTCPFVFHRNGRPVKSFRKAFEAAAAAAGRPDMVPHDLRRSAVRNFRKAGLSETEGMKLSGHKTNSVYRRYDIIDENDLRESMAQVQRYLKRQTGQSNVVKLKKKA
jgi:integrase